MNAFKITFFKNLFQGHRRKLLPAFRLYFITLIALHPLALMSQSSAAVSNVAKGKVAKQSSTGQPNGLASLAVDGNTNGVWQNSNNTISHSGGETDPWWEVDLGGRYDISEIKIWNRTDDCCWNRLKNFYVMVSDDPIAANSTTAKQYAKGPLSFNNAQEAKKSLQGNARGRYVRIFIAGGSQPQILSLAEVEVMGSEVEVNLAKGKVAKQSSTGQPNGLAALAVDGNTSGLWQNDNNTISHTGGDAGPWWEVDLGSVSDISEIKIWNRTDCCWDRLQNFYVMVSESPITANSTTANQYMPGPLSFNSAGEASKSLKKTARGRYVRIFIAGDNNILSLAEVEVMKYVQTTNNNKFVIEMLGTRGEMTFPDDISKKPTSATITLYGLTSSNVLGAYNLINGKWTGDVFEASVRDKNNPSKTTGIFPQLEDAVNYIKLVFSSGKFEVVGAVSMEAYPNNIFGNSSSSLVLGYSPSKKSIFPQNPSNQVFATVIRDKHAGKDAAGQYDVGWWMNSDEVATSTFREVLLLRDDLLEEIALYAFEKDQSRGLENVNNFKILAYDLKEIKAKILTVFPSMAPNDYYFSSSVRADLMAFAITEVLKKYPSKVFGLKSTGHGSPIGIMNEFLREDKDMERCLSWAKSVRGKSIDFIDVGTNCNAGSFYNLKTLSPYVDYALASDLERFPTNTDNLSTFFTNPSTSVKDILINMMDDELNRQVNSCTSCKKFVMQFSLFDCKELGKMMNQLGSTASDQIQQAFKNDKNKNLIYLEGTTKQVDFKTAIPVLFPGYTNFAADWQKTVIKQVNNRSSVNADVAKIPEATGLLLTRVY